jgi:hypothetical protein
MALPQPLTMGCAALKTTQFCVVRPGSIPSLVIRVAGPANCVRARRELLEPRPAYALNARSFMKLIPNGVIPIIQLLSRNHYRRIMQRRAEKVPNASCYC